MSISGEPFEQSKELPSISYTLADIDPTQISVQLNGMNFANTNAKRSINHSGLFLLGKLVCVIR